MDSVEITKIPAPKPENDEVDKVKAQSNETKEHVAGKQLIYDWLKSQNNVIAGSVVNETKLDDYRLRPDVSARSYNHTLCAFEMQRATLDDEIWERRHGGYRLSGIRDTWFYPASVREPRLFDYPTSSVMIDVKKEMIGLHLVKPKAIPSEMKDYVDPTNFMDFAHPSFVVGPTRPTHYAWTYFDEWSLNEEGLLCPPESLSHFLDPEGTTEYRRGLEKQSKSLEKVVREPWDAIKKAFPFRGWDVARKEPSKLYVSNGSREVVFLDRTVSFSFDEYRSARRRYDLQGVNDIWMVNSFEYELYGRWDNHLLLVHTEDGKTSSVVKDYVVSIEEAARFFTEGKSIYQGYSGTASYRIDINSSVCRDCKRSNAVYEISDQKHVTCSRCDTSIPTADTAEFASIHPVRARNTC
jgi:hypothetical protein